MGCGSAWLANFVKGAEIRGFVWLFEPGCGGENKNVAGGVRKLRGCLG